jgi:hypothetical protein
MYRLAHVGGIQVHNSSMTSLNGFALLTSIGQLGYSALASEVTSIDGSSYSLVVTGTYRYLHS